MTKDAKENSTIEWETQKECVDIGKYELAIEKQKTDWKCEQNRQSWKWIISYHGSVVSSGSTHSEDEAKEKAVANCPVDK